jgi:hypothetical protein
MVAIVCPAVGAMSVNGTANLEVQKTGQFSFEEPDVTFDASGGSAADFAENFIVISSTADNAQDYSLSLESGAKDALKAALKAAAARAYTDGYDTVHNKFDADNRGVNHYALNWMQGYVKGLLEADGVAAFLSAEELKDLALTDFNASCDAAADDLWSKLDVANLNLIVEQLGNDFWMRSTGDAADPTRLPLQAGDSLLFRFVLTPSVSVEHVEIEPKSTVADPAMPPAPPAGSYAMTAAGTKTIHVVLTFT